MKKPEELILDEDWKKWYSSVEINSKKNKDFSEYILKEIKANFSDSEKLANGLFPKQINYYGHKMGFILVENKLKYSQLRRFVDALKTIDNISDWETKKFKVELFPIQLVHGLARKEELEPFVILIKGIIERDWIKETDDFETLLSLVDSITAYFEVFENKEANS